MPHGRTAPGQQSAGAEPAGWRHAAALMWVTAPFSGGLSAVIALAVSWDDRGSSLRRHALFATWLYGVLLVIYLPVFVVGWFYGSFARGGPGPVTIGITAALALIGIAASIAGVVTALRARPRAGGEAVPRRPR